MIAKIGPSFSGTQGAGDQIQKFFVFGFDIEKCNYLTDKSITSFETLKQGKITQKKQQVIDRLELFAQKLRDIYKKNIDPIKFLIFLYYKEELSVEEIYQRYFDFGYKNSSSLWHMLSQSLKWELRDNYEHNERRLRKKRSDNNPALIGLQRNATELKDTNISKCIQILESLDLDRHKSDFSLTTFDSFEGKGSKGEKILYILQSIHGITPETLLSINSEYGIGARTLTRVINTKIQSSCILYNITYPGLELQSGYISYILQREKKKKSQS